MDIVFCQLILVEQLGQVVECLFVFVGGHSVKLGCQLQGTEQYDLLSVWQTQLGKNVRYL